MQLDVGQKRALFVNGERIETSAALLGELIAELGYRQSEVATALNGEFVPKASRDTTRLAAGDSVEIVAPRQGG
jgi:sulfur carrier protein